jgi:hypothetical protein
MMAVYQLAALFPSRVRARAWMRIVQSRALDDAASLSNLWSVWLQNALGNCCLPSERGFVVLNGYGRCEFAADGYQDRRDAAGANSARSCCRGLSASARSAIWAPARWSGPGWLPAGRGHVYLHGGVRLWDYAAGSLLSAEVGGVSATLEGEPVFQPDPGPRARYSQPPIRRCSKPGSVNSPLLPRCANHVATVWRRP